MEIKPFPKIFALGTSYIKDIFNDEVEITEKLDGSQFGFGKLDGNIVFRSKGKVIYPESADKMFLPPIEYVINALSDKLPEDTVFYGEILNSPRHNVLKYTRNPRNRIALFGMCDKTHTSFFDYDSISTWAKVFKIDVVPLIYKGKISSHTEITDMLDRESYLGGQKIEGVVVKNYTQVFLLGGQPIPFMAGKLVCETFKEVARSSWNTENTSKGKWETFVSSFKTEARWLKAVQHLREDGKLTSSVKDIGSLIKEIKKDIEEEEKENIKNFLWSTFGQDILRKATMGVPEWYKEKLLKDSMEKE